LKIQGQSHQSKFTKFAPAGLKPTSNDLVGMKVQGNYAGIYPKVREINSNRCDSLDRHEVKGITAAYRRTKCASRLQPGYQRIAMNVQGITPEYVRPNRKLGSNRRRLIDW